MIRHDAHQLYSYLTLPRAAWRVVFQDWRDSGETPDPGVERAVRAMARWLCLAQDKSASRDGGIARHYSLIAGWGPSYPETTGYIVPILLSSSTWLLEFDLEPRARRALNWLVSIQLANGAFQGGPIGAKPVVPVAFNTGQVLLGLVAGWRAWGDYQEPLERAAMFLRGAQDPDGGWRRYFSPFAQAGPKAYDAHVAWGLLEAETALPGRGFADAAMRNIQWALSRQSENGWFNDCCLTDHSQPLTHAIGYALRGLIEAYRFSGDRSCLKAALKTARALIQAQRPDGALPGRLNSAWRPTVTWSCLTGNAQIAVCWLQLFEETGDHRFVRAAQAANAYMRRGLVLQGDPDIVGGVKGSHPINGDYGRFEYLSWAARFAIEANLLERSISNE